MVKYSDTWEVDQTEEDTTKMPSGREQDVDSFLAVRLSTFATIAANKSSSILKMRNCTLTLLYICFGDSDHTKFISVGLVFFLFCFPLVGNSQN